MNIAIRAALLGLVALLPINAAAQGAVSAVSLAGDVKLEKLAMVGGVEKVTLVEPKVVVPGNRLLFTTQYRNTSAAPVKNFVVTNPVPAAVSITGDAAASAQVSVDGGKTWGALAALTVAGSDGKRRAAQNTDVTHLRWTIPVIAPGASGALTYHAIVR